MQKIFPDSRPVTPPVTPVIGEQGELSLIGLLKAPASVLDPVLRSFGDDEEQASTFAIQWAWSHRRVKGMSQSTAAEHIGIAASHFCNILAGKKYLPPHKINAFEWVTGQRAVSMTIDRFRAIREAQQTNQLAQVIAAQMVRAA